MTRWGRWKSRYGSDPYVSEFDFTRSIQEEQLRTYYVTIREPVYDPETDSYSWPVEKHSFQATRHELVKNDLLRLFRDDEVIAQFHVSVGAS